MSEISEIARGVDEACRVCGHDKYRHVAPKYGTSAGLTGCMDCTGLLTGHSYVADTLLPDLSELRKAVDSLSRTGEQQGALSAAYMKYAPKVELIRVNAAWCRGAVSVACATTLLLRQWWVAGTFALILCGLIALEKTLLRREYHRAFQGSAK